MQNSSLNQVYYRPELDALRFFAFASVFCFHLMDYVTIDKEKNYFLHTLCTSGAFGVPVFFLLSSYLIVHLLLVEFELTNQIHLKSFYVRRILRIWPLYFLVLIGLVVLEIFVGGIATTQPQALIAFIFFYGNWYIFNHGWIAGPIDPLWSISIEEQFYLMIPILIRFFDPKKLTYLSLLLIFISYLLCIYYATLHYHGESGQWLNSFFQFQFFGAGALLALYLKDNIVRMSFLSRLIFWSLGILCWFLAVDQFDVKSYDGHPSILGGILGWLLVLLGTLLFFRAVLGIKAPLVPKALVYLGRISFGLYLFHSLIFHLIFHNLKPYWAEPLAAKQFSSTTISFVGVAFVVALTIGLASLSYHYFEQPFLKLKKRYTIVKSRPI